VLHNKLINRALCPGGLAWSLNNVSWDTSSSSKGNGNPGEHTGEQGQDMEGWEGEGEEEETDGNPSLAGRYRLDLSVKLDRQRLGRLIELANSCGRQNFSKVLFSVVLSSKHTRALTFETLSCGRHCWRNECITHTKAPSIPRKTHELNHPQHHSSAHRYPSYVFPPPSRSTAAVSSALMSATSTTVRRRIWFDAASIVSTLAFPLEGEAAVAAAQEKADAAEAAEQEEKKGGKGGKEGKAGKKVTEKGKGKKVGGRGGKWGGGNALPKSGIITVDIMTPPPHPKIAATVHGGGADGEARKSSVSWGQAGAQREEEETLFIGPEWEEFSQLIQQLQKCQTSLSQQSVLARIRPTLTLTTDKAILIYKLLCHPKISRLAVERRRGDISGGDSDARCLDCFVALLARITDDEAYRLEQEVPAQLRRVARARVGFSRILHPHDVAGEYLLDLDKQDDRQVLLRIAAARCAGAAGAGGISRMLVSTEDVFFACGQLAIHELDARWRRGDDNYKAINAFIGVPEAAHMEAGGAFLNNHLDSEGEVPKNDKSGLAQEPGGGGEQDDSKEAGTWVEREEMREAVKKRGEGEKSKPAAKKTKAELKVEQAAEAERLAKEAEAERMKQEDIRAEQEREEKIGSCQAVPFGHLWFLEHPGDLALLVSPQIPDCARRTGVRETKDKGGGGEGVAGSGLGLEVRRRDMEKLPFVSWLDAVYTPFGLVDGLMDEDCGIEGEAGKAGPGCDSVRKSRGHTAGKEAIEGDNGEMGGWVAVCM
jgi:hypothetical protein